MPTIWGLHDYSDVNRFESWRTREVARALGGQVWLTETSGSVKFGGAFPNVHGGGRSVGKAKDRQTGRTFLIGADAYLDSRPIEMHCRLGEGRICDQIILGPQNRSNEHH